MAGILVKGLISYDYEKAVRGSSFIRLYDANGFCFKSFLDISPAGFADYKNYVLTSDTASVSGKTYYVRSGEAGSYTFVTGNWSKTAYELINIAEYEVADVAGVGTIPAECGTIANKKLPLTLPNGVYAQNKLQVNFKTPVASNDISHIVIDEIEFELVDSSAICVTEHKFAFEANTIVSVILDLESKRAFVQNLTLKIDDVVTENSDNLVTSDAVFNFVEDKLANDVDASAVKYNGNASGIGADNVQGAIDSLMANKASNATATETNSGLMTPEQVKTLHDLASSTGYSLAQATSDTLGGVKIGYTENEKNYPVELNNDGQMFVNVPWTDEDTKYEHPDKHPASMIEGLATVATTGKYSDLSGTPAAYVHPDKHPASMIEGLATVATTGSYNDLNNKPTIPAAYVHPTYIDKPNGLYKVAVENGHIKEVTEVTKKDITDLGIPAQDTVYTLPNATSDVLGGVKIGNNISNDNGTISITKDNITTALGYIPPESVTVKIWTIADIERGT